MGKSVSERVPVVAVLAILAIVAFAPGFSQPGFAENREDAGRAGLTGVTGAAASAASAAGPRAAGSLTENTVASAAFIRAGPGAIIAAAPEVMAISTGVAAAGMIGVLSTRKGE
jgi:hypothetical protein